MKYSNTLSFILAIILLVSTTANESWKCYPDSNHRCPSTSQTCCPSIHSSAKYVCFESPNGNCCPDDENFCPNGYKCNMIKLRCDPENPVLSFLSEEEPTNDALKNTGIIPYDSSLELKRAPSPGDILNFTKGFFEGLAVFSNLPQENDCLNVVTDSSIPNDVVQIYELIKSLNLHSDFLSIIKSISWYAIDIYTKISDAVAPCKNLALEIKKVGEKVIAVFRSDKYLEKLALHLVLYVGDVKDRATRGYEAIVSGDYHTSGQAFGDLLKFVLLWEYKN